MRLSLLFESAGFLKYLIGKLPNIPKYVIKDFVYQALKGAGRGDEGRWNWDGLNNSYENMGPLDRTIWTKKPKLIQFEMGMFNDWTQKMLRTRISGKKPEGFELPGDEERHQIQKDRLGPSEKAFSEPVILFFDGKEYESIEGWHRTIQAFSRFGDGFKAMAYVGRKGS